MSPWARNTNFFTASPVRAERTWPEGVVRRLQLVAQVFTNALARRRHELIRQESEARLAADQEPDSELAVRGMDEELTGTLVTTMALGGEEVSRMVLGQVGRMLGVGLSNFVNITTARTIETNVLASATMRMTKR